jgi:hypothetical protein
VVTVRALVVYESLFGNTKLVAEAIADGLRATMEVDLKHVGDVAEADTAVELIVIGGPTHALSMTRASTRADAVKQGAPRGPDVGIREWLVDLQPGPSRALLATFDTKVLRARRMPGAARAAARGGRRRGFKLAAGPKSFWVTGTRGPLLVGELERARTWGATLAGVVMAKALRTR